jgi:hypothetical protein
MNTPYGETFIYEVLIWGDDDAEYNIDFLEVFSKAHAKLELRNGIHSGKYPKGAYVERCRDTDKYAEQNGFVPGRYCFPARKGA